MFCHLTRPAVRAVAVATLLGTTVVAGVSSAVSRALADQPPIAADTSIPADGGTPSGAAAATPAPGEGSGQPGFDLVAQRIAYLHDRLRITPAQEPLWANLAQVMQDNARALAPLLKQRFQAVSGGSAVDRLNADAKLDAAQLDGLKQFTAAFQELYASLSDEQKKIADVVFRRAQRPEEAMAPLPYTYYPSEQPAPAAPYATDVPDAASVPAMPEEQPDDSLPDASALALAPLIGLVPPLVFRGHSDFHHHDGGGPDFHHPGVGHAGFGRPEPGHPGFVPMHPPAHISGAPSRVAVMPMTPLRVR
jgi:hypothetical protein